MSYLRTHYPVEHLERELADAHGRISDLRYENEELDRQVDRLECELDECRAMCNEYRLRLLELGEVVDGSV